MRAIPLLLGMALAGTAAALAAAPAPQVDPIPNTVPLKEAVPAYVKKAMDDPARKADQVNDIRRQMAAVLTFSGVKPGGTVMELLPGTGYWTRAFSQIVGPKGHVYSTWADNTSPDSKNFVLWQGLVKTPHYANVSLLKVDMQAPHAPKPVDVVYTNTNYHDLFDPYWGPNKQPLDIAKFNQAIFAALKPGGLFVVVDHAAPAGAGTSDTNTLHRIDPASVRQQVEAAGFVFDGSSDALVNPEDPLTIKVFDKAIEGHTSQFIYRFRKPLR